MVDTDCGVRDTVDGNQKSRKTHHFRWWNLVVYLIIKWNDTVDGNQKSGDHSPVEGGSAPSKAGGWPWDFWLPSTVYVVFLLKK